MLSIPHMIVVFVVVLVIFGPQKLPELARSFGKLMAEFRKASGDFKSAFEEEMRDLERQARIADLKKQAAEATAAAAAALNSIGNPASPATPAATLASPAGTATETSSYPENTVTKAPVITPVAGSVPRLDVSAGESVSPVSTEIVAEAKQSELKFEDELSDSTTAESNPSHDQQQPA
ncbi:MAG TPA: twin-arginine translocase TatA/TatE family subunit [Candidatus Acidoferrum sp.]|nr:twin-arginine translocase TatA/TatE family subunit [Candidatus Acidoferrum sp.]